MAETFYPLFIATAGSPNFDENDGGNIIPDWVNDKIYSFTSFSFFSGGVWQDYIWAHKASDGSAISSTFAPTALAVSTNQALMSQASCLGTDGKLYFVTTKGTTGATKKASLRLSKIDTGTMTEAAAVGLNASSYTFPIVDFRMTAFSIGGVNYVATAMCAVVPANFEVFNVDTMTSVANIDFLRAFGQIWIVAGEKPTATAQKIYLLSEEHDVLGTGTGPPSIVAITFDNITGLSQSVVHDYAASEFDAAWTRNNLDAAGLSFDTTDGSLIFGIHNPDYATEGGTPGYIVKASGTTGALAWTVPVPQIYYYFSTAAGFSDLSGGTLIFVPSDETWPAQPYSVPAGTGAYYTITLATGAYVVSFSTHFESMRSLPYAPLWDSVRSLLLFWSTGTNDFRDGPPAWYEGWAAWGPDIPPATASLFYIVKT